MKSKGRHFRIAVFLATFGLGILNLSAATTHYVWLDSPNPTPPFSTWETAAHVIQDAVDVAAAGSTVLVTNGVYSVGEREAEGTTRVVVSRPITLQSVNGPTVTVIVGEGVDGEMDSGVRCVSLSEGATLSGFTLTNAKNINHGGGVLCDSSSIITNCILTANSAHLGSGAFGGKLYSCLISENRQRPPIGCELEGGGGGAHGSTLYKCTLTGNASEFGGGASWCTLYDCDLIGNSVSFCGGGASYSTLNNCTVVGNSANESGGGAQGCVLNNCTLTGNSAPCEGGVNYSTLNNCILYYNTATNAANYSEGEYGSALNYCCTVPLPATGVGNITGPPLLMDLAGGDYRLREDSPCIDAGTNLFGAVAVLPWGGEPVRYTHTPTDVLGNTRFIDGNGDGVVAWDIGAYEFNSFPPPKFNVQPELTSHAWKFTITGAPNKWVGLQRTSDFSGWWDLQPPIFTGSEGRCEITDSDTEPKVMFYRAVVW